MIKRIVKTRLSKPLKKKHYTDYIDATMFSGLYFAAQWCPSCVDFTRELIEFYTHFKASESQRATSLDIVLVSLDEDDHNWRVTFRDMPWMAVPFHALETLVSLNTRYFFRFMDILLFLKYSFLVRVYKVLIVIFDDVEFPFSSKINVKISNSIIIGLSCMNHGVLICVF